MIGSELSGSKYQSVGMFKLWNINGHLAASHYHDNFYITNCNKGINWQTID
jgi:hypothetical protein